MTTAMNLIMGVEPQDAGACVSDQEPTPLAVRGGGVLSFKTSFVENLNNKGQVINYSTGLLPIVDSIASPDA